MDLLLILPGICFVLLFYDFFLLSKLRSDSGDWRDAFIDASVLWGLLLWFITETLSLVNAITQCGVSLSWFSCCIGIAFHLIPLHRRQKPAKAFFPPGLTTDIYVTCIVAAVITVTIVLLVIALFAPPNNWDSMNYHMSRVEQWIQDQNIKHFPTNISKQLFLNPGAEYFILHLQILSCSDRYANLVQWLSMFGSLIVVSAIARFLGVTLLGQVLSAVFVITLPMGILQSTSTQNDYAISFLLACFVYYCLHFFDDVSYRKSVMIGSSLGLAILAKATAYLFALPVCLWFIVRSYHHSKGTILKHWSLITLCVVMINSGHYLRNYLLYDHPVAPEKYRGINVNQDVTASLFISGMVKNLCIHLGTPGRELNEKITDMVLHIHEKMGVDINDPRITYETILFSMYFSNNEDTAGNTVHFIVILISGLALLYPMKKGDNFPRLYFFLFFLAFLLFCFIIRWGPWNGRYHLPLFVVIAPVVGYVWTARFPQRVPKILIALLLLTSLPWVFCNYCRPLYPGIFLNNNFFTISAVYQPDKNILSVPREEQYFAAYPALGPSYLEAARIIRSSNCDQIGIIGHEGIWDYPFWPLTNERCSRSRTYHHIVVNENHSKNGYNFLKENSPCMLLILLPERRATIPLGYSLYSHIWSAGPVNLYVKNNGWNFREAVISE